MKDEIKEILDRAKKLKYKCSCCEQIGKDVYISKYHEIETQNLIEAVYIIDKLLDYITNLQEGNHNLLQEIEDMQNKNNKLIERNKKAIEYIKNRLEEGCLDKLNYYDLHKIENILQGEDK